MGGQPGMPPQAAFSNFGGMDPNWAAGGPGLHMHPPGMSGYHHHAGGIQPGGMEGGLIPTVIPGLPGHSMDPMEAVLGPFPCARLRNLPLEASLEDILVFFQGLVVLDVVVVATTSSEGRGVGEAFVIFANPMDFQMALQRDRQPMGQRFIEVFQGKRADYYAAIATNLQQHSPDNQGVIVGDLEASSVAGGQPSVEDASQVNVWGSSVPPSAHALLPMPGAPVPVIGGGGATGMKSKGHVGMSGGRGNRGGTVGLGATPGGPPFPGRGSGRGGGIQVGEHTGYLRMRGLPFSASKDDVMEFFKVYNPVEGSILLTVRSDGRATGEAYVAFSSPDDSKKAMALHRSMMGSRYIELFISNKDEHTRALSRSSGR